MQRDVTIIGAGPVGLFAIFQAGMLGMKCHVIDALETIGGQCVALYPEKPIYDIPAYPEIGAAELIKQLHIQASPFEPIYYNNQQAVALSEKNGIFEVTTSNNIKIQSKIVIIAAGSGAFGPNRPPIDNIEEFEGKSVFYLIKNRELFANKEVVIAGGGDSAVDWAISLSEITKKLYLVHRRNKFRAMDSNVQKLYELEKAGKLELVIGYQLDQIEGSKGYIQSVGLKDLNGNSKILKSDFLLPFFGLMQDLGLISNWGLDIKAHHILVSNPYCQTNIEGIYAIGDVATYEGKLKLILTGFSEAASALHHAYGRVFNRALHFEYSTTKGIQPCGI